MDFNNYVILVILSGIVLISHFFNVAAKFFKIPSVLFLIAFGMLVKAGCVYFSWPVLDISKYVSFLGAIGLILIVLEGVLDLKVRRRNLALIEKSFVASLVILLLSVGAISALLHFWLKADWISAVVNAIPLAVISSAVVIPSIHHLSREKKDFLTYEAIFSDILGIMLFNFILAKGASSFAGFTLQTVLVMVGSLIVSFFLIFFIYQMKTKTKVFIILSLLVLVYAVGELFHLSSLLLVFTFGLLLCNYSYVSRLLRVGRVKREQAYTELNQFTQIVDESAFLIRTFFFITFGYSIDLLTLLNVEVLMLGVPIVLILLAVRFVYLNNIVKTHVFPELFIAPKGLITIVLFYSIPQGMLIPSISSGVLLFVILATSLLMIIGGGRHEEENLE